MIGWGKCTLQKKGTIVNPFDHGKNLYPLEEHILGIVESKDPEDTLKKELSRYVNWVVRGYMDLQDAYTDRFADPLKRPAETWTEEDKNYIRLNGRNTILSKLLDMAEKEEVIVRNRPKHKTPVKTYTLLENTLGQMHSLPCPFSKVAINSVVFSMQLTPPFQHVCVEERGLHVAGNTFSEPVLAKLYQEQSAFLKELITNWVYEHVPVEKLPIVTKKYFAISENWEVVIY